VNTQSTQNLNLHTPALNAADINDALKSNYVLIELTNRTWSARRPDHALASELAANHNASPDAFRATKNLMASVPEYKAVVKALNALRTYHYDHTLPWSDNSSGPRKGPRLLNANKVMPMIAAYKRQQDEIKQLIAELQQVYPQRVAQALARQGTAGDSTQYPDVADLPDLFGASFDIKPVPTVGDFGKMAIPSQLADLLGRRMADRQTAAAEAAMLDLQERVANAVGNMAEQLGKYSRGEKTRLYKSVVTNVERLAGLLRDSNFANDSAMDALADKLDKLTELDITQLKANPGKASEIAGKAAEIAAEIGKPMPERANELSAPEAERVVAVESKTLPESAPDQVQPDEDIDAAIESIMNW